MPKTVEEIRKELSDAIVLRDGGITNANAQELLDLGKPEPAIKMVKKNIMVSKSDGSIIENIEVEVPLTGMLESVSIGATINLGNYNNLKIEVSASNGDYARYIFEQEARPTLELVQGIIKKVNAKG
jgi:hypothetical protein